MPQEVPERRNILKMYNHKNKIVNAQNNVFVRFPVRRGPPPTPPARAPVMRGPSPRYFYFENYSNSGKLMWKDNCDLKKCCWNLTETDRGIGKLLVSLW